MNATASPQNILEIFTVPKNGSIGLVDRLLELARGRSLRVEWRNDQLTVRLPEMEAIGIPFRKGVFRDALARIDVLCEQYSRDSVSPYGGMGRLSSGGDQPTVFRVDFVNTMHEQRLELIDEQVLQRFLSGSTPCTNGVALPPS